MTSVQKKKLQKFSVKSGLLALAGFVLVSFLIVCTLGYTLASGNRVGEALRKTLPLPLVFIPSHSVITTRELSSNIRSVRQFYEVQDLSKYGIRVDFSTDEGQKRLSVREKEVLNKMLEDREVMLMAREQGITVTPEAAREGIRRKLEEYGGTADNVAENLKRLYGWSMQDFEQKVVIPNLYEERLIQFFEKKSDDNTRAEQRIKAAREALRGGTSFEDALKQYSEGRTKDNGGELGWFGLQDLAKELQPSIEKQKLGVVGDVVESEIGFHIVVVEEIKQDGGKTFYRLKQIFTKKKTVVDWLIERMRASPPYILSRKYVWDSESGRIQFRDENMRRFEQSLSNQVENNTSTQ